MDWSGVLGNIGGAVIGGLFGKSSAKDQFENQKRLMDLQHQYQVHDYQHRYQWSTADMRASGLNPILAATQGIGGNISGVSAGNAAIAPTPDFAGAVNSGLSLNQMKKQLQIQEKLQSRDLDLKERQVGVDEMRAETEWMNVFNQMQNRNKEMDLKSADQAFRHQLAERMQDFYEDTRLQELGATIRHMAAQDANLAAMSEAALRNASVQEMLADVARENGISHRQLEAAQAVFLGDQAEFLRKQGDTEEARQALLEAQESYTKFLEQVGPIKTATDLMSGILSVAIGAKVGYSLYNDIVPNSGKSIGF